MRPVAGNDLYVRRLHAARVRELAQDLARLLAYFRQLFAGGVRQWEVWEDAGDIDRRTRRLGKQLCQLQRVERPFGGVDGGDDALVSVQLEPDHPIVA